MESTATVITVTDKAAGRIRQLAEREGRPDPLPTFDMGPPLEEILARCEEETGLPAPKAPIAR